jgi:hypothetical protein
MAESDRMARLCRVFDDSIVLVADPPARGVLALAKQFALPSVIARMARALACDWDSQFALATG